MQVPLNRPSFGQKEEDAILDAFRSGWVTTGPYCERLEEGFKSLTGRRHAVACSSGTAALWLAIAALNLPAGQRVLTQSYTCDSVANAALSVTGQPPLVCDVDAGTWGIRAADVFRALAECREIGAVTFNHSYGVPSRDTEEVVAICRRLGFPVIEDASEAHGAKINGRPAGSFGDISIFSCRGEKSVSGGQLGMVVTDDERLARKVKQLAHNGLPAATVRYWSTMGGLNFQPAHLNAALACAQLERLPELVQARNAVHARWVTLFSEWVGKGIEFQCPYGEPAWWLTGILMLPDFTAMLPQDLGAALLERGIQTRPGFYPLHTLPHVGSLARVGDCSFSERLLRSLLILPSGPDLTLEEQQYVAEHLLDVIGK